MTDDYLTDFTFAYLECAIWADLRDENGESLDNEYGVDELASESFLTALHTCAKFVWSNLEDLVSLDNSKNNRSQYSDGELAGHDFWLTRCHHGAGFWDRGDGEIGDRLTKAAHVYGEEYLYVGDDGKVRFGQ